MTYERESRAIRDRKVRYTHVDKKDGTNSCKVGHSLETEKCLLS